MGTGQTTGPPSPVPEGSRKSGTAPSGRFALREADPPSRVCRIWPGQGSGSHPFLQLRGSDTPSLRGPRPFRLGRPPPRGEKFPAFPSRISRGEETALRGRGEAFRGAVPAGPRMCQSIQRPCTAIRRGRPLTWLACGKASVESYRGALRAMIAAPPRGEFL